MNPLKRFHEMQKKLMSGELIDGIKNEEYQQVLKNLYLDYKLLEKDNKTMTKKLNKINEFSNY